MHGLHNHVNRAPFISFKYPLGFENCLRVWLLTSLFKSTKLLTLVRTVVDILDNIYPVFGCLRRQPVCLVFLFQLCSQFQESLALFIASVWITDITLPLPYKSMWVINHLYIQYELRILDSDKNRTSVSIGRKSQSQIFPSYFYVKYTLKTGIWEFWIPDKKINGCLWNTTVRPRRQQSRKSYF